MAGGVCPNHRSDHRTQWMDLDKATTKEKYARALEHSVAYY